MYGIYANIGGILMGSMLPYIAYMDPMGTASPILGYAIQRPNDSAVPRCPRWVPGSEFLGLRQAPIGGEHFKQKRRQGYMFIGMITIGIL